MPEIREALVTVAATKPGLEKLFAALAPTKVNYVMPYAPDAKEKIAEYAKTADVAILNGDLDDSILAGENLKWIHCCHAGLDRSARPEVFERGIILTSSSGRSAPALAQHAMLFLEALTYELPMLFEAQREHRWAASREYAQKVGIFGRTIGIIGLGKNGMEMARLAKVYDMTVLGWDRRRGGKENVDEVYGAEDGDKLTDLLAQCDYVVLCIELNDQTFHMMGAEQFKAMKPTAFLVNMARGKVVDEKALIAALQSGEIGGAGHLQGGASAQGQPLVGHGKRDHHPPLHPFPAGSGGPDAGLRNPKRAGLPGGDSLRQPHHRTEPVHRRALQG